MRNDPLVKLWQGLAPEARYEIIENLLSREEPESTADVAELITYLISVTPEAEHPDLFAWICDQDSPQAYFVLYHLAAQLEGRPALMACEAFLRHYLFEVDHRYRLTDLLLEARSREVELPVLEALLYRTELDRLDLDDLKRVFDTFTPEAQELLLQLFLARPDVSFQSFAHCATWTHLSEGVRQGVLLRFLAEEQNVSRRVQLLEHIIEAELNHMREGGRASKLLESAFSGLWHLAPDKALEGAARTLANAWDEAALSAALRVLERGVMSARIGAISQASLAQALDKQTVVAILENLQQDGLQKHFLNVALEAARQCGLRHVEQAIWECLEPETLFKLGWESNAREDGWDLILQ